MRSLFVQTLMVCQQVGLVKLGRVALDGSKVKANASRHKAMSYERLLETEQRLQQEIDCSRRSTHCCLRLSVLTMMTTLDPAIVMGMNFRTNWLGESLG